MTDVQIELGLSSLVECETDAIVCPAHWSLLAGSGLCGAIHKAAGKALEDECIQQKHELFGPSERLPGGAGLVTSGYGLKARWVIHVVVPRPAVLPRDPDTSGQLAQCYRTIFHLAREKGISSLAIPGLGTGVYNWPRDQACSIAIPLILQGLAESPSIQRLILSCYDQELARLYGQHLEAAGQIFMKGF